MPVAGGALDGAVIAIQCNYDFARPQKIFFWNLVYELIIVKNFHKCVANININT